MTDRNGFYNFMEKFSNSFKIQSGEEIFIDQIKGLIFDLDGVIIDSEPLHKEAKQLTLQHYQIDIPRTTYDDFKGIPDQAFFDYVVENYSDGTIAANRLNDYKREVYVSLSERLELVRGAEEFISAARQHFPSLAVVTSATRHNQQLAFNRFALGSLFDVILVKEDVEFAKPHPAPYLKALSLMNLSAGACLIVEDSPNGVRSGKAAGCYVAAITNSFDPEILLQAGADLIVESFAQLARQLNFREELKV